MGKKARLKLQKSALRVGECIKINDPYLGVRELVGEVVGLNDMFVSLQVGELSLGINRKMIRITERNVPKPLSWTSEEIKMLKGSAQTCDCEECRQTLRDKQAQLVAEKMYSV